MKTFSMRKVRNSCLDLMFTDPKHCKMLHLLFGNKDNGQGLKTIWICPYEWFNITDFFQIPRETLDCEQFWYFIAKLFYLATMEVYAKEKPNSCDVCSKIFSKKRDLNKHFRIHKVVKPYGCDICLKALSSSSNLDVHSRIHTGEKPYRY